MRALPLPEPPPAEAAFVTIAEVEAGASLLAGVVTAVMSQKLKRSCRVQAVVGVISVSLAPAHTVLLSICAARRTSNDVPIRTI